MSEFEKVWPKTEEEFLEHIRKIMEPWKKFDYEKATQEEREKGYNDAAEAMWQAALVAFNYASSVVGASGFQAGYAALKFYGQVMHLQGPYAIIDGENLLYPQYDIRAKVDQYINEWTTWAAQEAKKKLEGDLSYVSPTVLAHWKELASVVK